MAEGTIAERLWWRPAASDLGFAEADGNEGQAAELVREECQQMTGA
ncbi:hypothetical protein [Streptomyces sp. NPDC050164]